MTRQDGSTFEYERNKGENRMCKMRKQWLLATSMILLVLRATANVPPDETLFTTYNINVGHTNVSWSVCGSTAQSSGCYSSGGLGTFGKIGALMESNPTINLSANTVTRDIYVLDIASGSNKTAVKLYVYRKTDRVTSSFDTVSVTLSKTISLPLVGGSTALASMAANNRVLVIGTNKSPNAVEIQKGTFGITQIGGFSPPINVSAITADSYGYVTITFGSFSVGGNGFVVLGPDGGTQEDGGGASFTLGTQQAVLPSTLH